MVLNGTKKVLLKLKNVIYSNYKWNSWNM